MIKKRATLTAFHRAANFLLFAVALLASACHDGGNGSDSSTDEGTREAPIPLTVGTPHIGGVGELGTSFYQFTVPAQSLFRIALYDMRSDLGWTLFSAPYFIFIGECDDHFDESDEICTVSNTLSAGATYHLAVDEYDGRASTYKLLVEAVVNGAPFFTGRMETHGLWALCKYDGATGHDIDEVLVIDGTSLTQRRYQATSTDSSCSGTRTLAETVFYTLTDTRPVDLGNWTDGNTTVAPPPAADPTMSFSTTLSATRVRATSSLGVEETWVWFIDDSSPRQARLYRGSAAPAAPCAADDSYPLCVLATEYYTRR